MGPGVGERQRGVKQLQGQDVSGKSTGAREMTYESSYRRRDTLISAVTTSARKRLGHNKYTRHLHYRKEHHALSRKRPPSFSYREPPWRDFEELRRRRSTSNAGLARSQL